MCRNHRTLHRDAECKDSAEEERTVRQDTRVAKQGYEGTWYRMCAGTGLRCKAQEEESEGIVES